MRATLITIFRVIGFAFGIVLIILGIGFFFSSPGTPPHTKSIEMLPTHDWKLKNFSSQAPTILQLDFRGVVGLTKHMQRQEVRKILVESLDGELKSSQIKALLLYIDTPGGTADDSAGIYQLIKEYKAKLNIPVIAYVDGMCASGGMYIACSADKIYSSRDSIVGSVGVIMPTIFNFSSILERLGIDSTTIYAGTGKDDLNPFRPWREDEEAGYQEIIDDAYNQFVATVSGARPALTKPILVEIGAQVFPADQSLTKGYIDEINNSYFAVLEQLATSLGIKDSYQIVQLTSGSLLEDLFSPEAKMIKGKVEHQLRIPGDIDPALVGKVLYMYHPTSPFAASKK